MKVMCIISWAHAVQSTWHHDMERFSTSLALCQRIHRWIPFISLNELMYKGLCCIFHSLVLTVQGIHRSSVASPHKGQWCRALIFSLICARSNGWVNNWDAGDLRCNPAHYDVTVIFSLVLVDRLMMPGTDNEHHNLVQYYHYSFHMPIKYFYLLFWMTVSIAILDALSYEIFHAQTLILFISPELGHFSSLYSMSLDIFYGQAISCMLHAGKVFSHSFSF